MTTTQKPRTASGMPGLKILLAAASVTATIGGWAWITSQPAQPAQAINPDSQIAALNLAPMPTVVPAPQAQSGNATTNNTGSTFSTAPQPPAVLRSVTLPSFPLFSTRSSH